MHGGSSGGAPGAGAGTATVTGLEPAAGGPAEVRPLDELDRRIVSALQLDGRASWTAVAERCGTSVPTVARRAERLFADGVIRVAVMPEVGADGPSESFVLRVTCRPGQQMRAMEELAAMAEVRFLALVTGEDDIVAECVIPRGASLFEHLVDAVQRLEGVERCRSDLLLHVYKVAHDWSRQLLGEGDAASAATHPHCQPAHFDDTDRAMLALLREDGRASFRALAQELGLNESTVRRRLERLQIGGCVAVVTLVPAAALGLESETLLRISVTPSRLGEVAAALASYRSVRYLAATLDGSSLLCEVIAESTEDLFSFTTQVLAPLPGVLGWAAAMEVMVAKRGFVTTPWWEERVRRASRPLAVEGRRGA
ncbi:Lrp/AsnC family transcriptional regulator [Pseudokineococcus marinus]